MSDSSPGINLKNVWFRSSPGRDHPVPVRLRKRSEKIYPVPVKGSAGVVTVRVYILKLYPVRYSYRNFQSGYIFGCPCRAEDEITTVGHVICGERWLKKQCNKVETAW